MPTGNFGLPIQTAPEWRGIIGSASSFATGTSDISTYGTYTKQFDVSGYGAGTLYVFQVATGGTIGSTATIEVTWTNGTTSGRLDLGTDASYTAGTKIYVEDGLSVAFSAGTLVAAEVSTLTCYAARRIPADFVRIEGDAVPADVQLQAGNRSTRDKLFPTDSGDLRRFSRRVGQNPRLLVNYQDGDAKRALEAIESRRHEVTVGENYDQHTIFLLRGGGAEPMIGRLPTFSRSGDYTGCGQDPVSGQIVPVESGEPRIFPGVQWESFDEGSRQDREHVPLVYNHIGRSIAVCQGIVTNLMTNSTGVSDSSPGWSSSSGGSTVSFDEGVLSPVAQDPNFPEGFGRGATRLEFYSTSDACDTDEAVVSGSTNYVVSLYTRGGDDSLIFYVKTGNGSAGTIRSTLTQPSATYWKSGGWQRRVTTVTTGSSDNRLKIEAVLATNNNAACYVAAAQVEANDEYQATAYIPTTSSTAARSAEVFTLNDEIPPIGTISFLFYDNGNPSGGQFSLVEATTGTRFGIRYETTSGSQDIRFFTDSSGALVAAFPGNDTDIWEWWHIAVTWQPGSSNTLAREVFINGASINSDTTSTYDYAWGPLKIFPDGASADLPRDFRIQELRMDGRVLSDQEILDQYERFTTDKWTHMMRNYAGRHFFVGGVSERWRALSSPGTLLADVALVESSVHEDSLMGEP